MALTLGAADAPGLHTELPYVFQTQGGGRSRRIALLDTRSIHEFAEFLPNLTIPAAQLQLRNGLGVGGGGIDAHTFKKCRQHDVLQIVGLMIDVFARKIGTALLEKLLEDFALLCPGEIYCVANVGPW